MPKLIHLYLDDSGTRHPDHKPGRLAKHGHDYFALSGVLIRDSDEEAARHLYDDFCNKWNINYPLHSVEIRGKNKNFSWIGELSKDQMNVFHEELYTLVSQAPLFAIACVIDRPGYNQRYQEKYGQNRWSLCKTAFTVLVERAAKYADVQGYRLRVLPEKCNKREDRTLKEYYDSLKKVGMPFNSSNSGKYKPLDAADFDKILYEFKPKEKTSPLVQLADLCLWPMAMGGYDKNNRPYKRLLDDGKLINCLYGDEEIPHLGIKYSCFDLVCPKPAIAS
jgi:Protein of unknown function (DUF3800)